MSIQLPITFLPSPSIFPTTTSSPPASSIAVDQQVSNSLSATSSPLSSQYPATSTLATTKSTGPPIAIIVAVIAGVLVVIIGVAVWFILRRRRQRRLANHDFNDDKDDFSRGRVSMSLKSFTRSKPSENQNLRHERHERHDGDGREGGRSSFSSGHRPDLEQPPSPHHQRQQSGHGHHHDNTGNNHTPQNTSQQPDGSPSTSHGFYDFSSCNDNTSTSPSPRQQLDQIESRSSRDHNHHHNHSDNDDASSCTITLSTTSSPSPPVSMVSSFSPTPTPPTPPPPKQFTANNSFLKPEVKNDVHIDMISMDLEVLLPVIISDEILVTSSPHPTTSQVGTVKSSVSTEVEEPSIEMPVPVPRRRPPSLATHRSPDSFIQGGRARISMCHPPPPPPPTNPPPEIPKEASSCSMPSSRRSRTSTYLSGRRSMSMDHQGKSGGSRNSVHCKDGQEEGDYLGRISTSSLWSSTSVAPLSPIRSRANSSPTIDFSSVPANRCPRTKKIILPPSCPPPPLPSSPPLNPRGRVRLSHQRSPSQVLNNSFWTSPQISPSSLGSPTLSSTGGPISPPLSPLTVQIPRPISKAFLNNTGINTAGSRPESPIISGSNSFMTARSSPPSSSLSHLPIPTRVVRQQQQQVHLLMQQEQRSRSHSLGDNEKVANPNETHRIIITPSSSASSSNCPSPQYPPVPSPPVPQSYLLLRRPSLVLQEQQAMSSSSGVYGHSGDPLRLSRAVGAASGSGLGLGIHQSYIATRSSSIAVPNSGRKSIEPPYKTVDSHQKSRRSMSLDSAGAAIATSAASSSSSDCPPSSSTAVHAIREQTEHGERADGGGHDDVAASEMRSSAGPSSSADQELQSIIADAIAIAAAKSAAIEAARHSTWYRQHQQRYQQMYQHQSSEGSLTTPTVNHRPWTPTPSEDYFPPWGSPSGAPSNSTSSSRSASPFHSSGSPS